MHNNNHPINEQTISFDKPRSNGKRYRCSAAVSTHLPASFTFTSDNLISKQQRVIITNDNNNASYTKSKPNDLESFNINTIDPYLDTNIDLQFQPLDIKTTPMTIETNLSPSPLSNPSSLAPTPTPSTSEYCNHINSYLASTTNAIQTINILDDILSHYNEEIEFETNLKSQCMDGLVFLFNQCIQFTIYIITENATSCRFEFRRTSGDAMVAAKFWSELKGLFERAIHPQNAQDDLFDFICLDLDTMHIGNEKHDELELDLDELTHALMENDLFVVDELTFLYEQVSANENICRYILAHDALMKHLVNESMQNTDICVVRIVLMILEQLAMIKGNGLVSLAQIDLFYNINLALGHERKLIRKCGMKLLAALCGAEWAMDEHLRSALIGNIKLCEKECDDELVKKINSTMFFLK